MEWVMKVNKKVVHKKINGGMVIIGAGAAGLFAALRCTELNQPVTILEHMNRPGRKLSISGKGRGNLGNSVELEDFLDAFGKKGRFLRQVFQRFFTPEMRDTFLQLGVPTHIERGGRIFPVSGRATDVTSALVRHLKTKGVPLFTSCHVERLEQTGDAITAIHTRLRDNIVVLRGFDTCLLATGGFTYPATGSDGSGYQLADMTGHPVVPPAPALVPLNLAGDIPARIGRLRLKNVGISISQSDLQLSGFGEAEFWPWGIGGPIVISLSGDLVTGLEQNIPTRLSIDLKPALDIEKLERRIQKDVATLGQKQCRDLLRRLLPVKLLPICSEATGIPLRLPLAKLTATQRKKLIAWLKDFGFDVSGTRPRSEALITRGGVDLSCVDPWTLRSRIVSNLYFAGEILDLDAETGGFNLQAAFSTGWVAATEAAQG